MKYIWTIATWMVPVLLLALHVSSSEYEDPLDCLSKETLKDIVSCVGKTLGELDRLDQVNYTKLHEDVQSSFEIDILPKPTKETINVWVNKCIRTQHDHDQVVLLTNVHVCVEITYAYWMYHKGPKLATSIM